MIFTRERRTVLARRLLLTLLAVGLPAWGLADEPTPAPQGVRVALHDGRAWQGWLDPRTDGERLWLRIERPGLRLWRPVAWSQIATVEADGLPLDLAQVRRDPTPWHTQAGPFTRGTGESRRPPLDALPRVTHIELSARAANWDDDVEADGVLVDLLPLDARGNLCPLSGNIELELIGEGPGTTQQLMTLQRWARHVERLEPAGLGPRGYSIQLPFQASHPEFDLRLGGIGVVHARLVVPGVGTFEATSDALGLRSFNPLRDRWQQETTERFFPLEQTGRGRLRRGPVSPP